jgi:hypothetical protein
VPPHIQSPPTTGSEPQKRKRSIFDEALPADLGKRNRKISKKAQGRNFDAKSDDEEKDDAKIGRGGKVRGRGRGKDGVSRGKKKE